MSKTSPSQHQEKILERGSSFDGGGSSTGALSFSSRSFRTSSAATSSMTENSGRFNKTSAKLNDLHRGRSNRSKFDDGSRSSGSLSSAYDTCVDDECLGEIKNTTVVRTLLQEEEEAHAYKVYQNQQYQGQPFTKPAHYLENDRFLAPCNQHQYESSSSFNQENSILKTSRVWDVRMRGDVVGMNRNTNNNNKRNSMLQRATRITGAAYHKGVQLMKKRRRVVVEVWKQLEPGEMINLENEDETVQPMMNWMISSGLSRKEEEHRDTGRRWPRSISAGALEMLGEEEILPSTAYGLNEEDDENDVDSAASAPIHHQSNDRNRIISSPHGTNSATPTNSKNILSLSPSHNNEGYLRELSGNTSPRSNCFAGGAGLERLETNEHICIKILMPVKKKTTNSNTIRKAANEKMDYDSDDDDDDNESLVSVSTVGMMGAEDGYDHKILKQQEWVDLHNFTLDQVELTKCVKNIVGVHLSQNMYRKSKDLFFDSENEGHSFFHLMQTLKRLIKERDKRASFTKINAINRSFESARSSSDNDDASFASKVSTKAKAEDKHTANTKSSNSFNTLERSKKTTSNSTICSVTSTEASNMCAAKNLRGTINHDEKCNAEKKEEEHDEMSAGTMILVEIISAILDDNGNEIFLSSGTNAHDHASTAANENEVSPLVDPCVIVKLNDKEIHRTDVVDKLTMKSTHNYIWDEYVIKGNIFSQNSILHNLLLMRGEQNNGHHRDITKQNMLLPVSQRHAELKQRWDEHIQHNNPIWTISSKSLFTLSLPPSESTLETDRGADIYNDEHNEEIKKLSSPSSLTFILRDVIKKHDKNSCTNNIRDSNVCYQAVVSLDDIVQGATSAKEHQQHHHRMELKLISKSKVNGAQRENYGKLNILCRFTTSNDITSIQYLEQDISRPIYGALPLQRIKSSCSLSENNCHDQSQQDHIAIDSSPIKNFPLTKDTGDEQTFDDDGIQKLNVQPGPDPPSKNNQCLTESELEYHSRKESREWIGAGSGSFGKIHVEVLGCDDLSGGSTGPKSGTVSPFVTLVYDDCVVHTDTIQTTKNPRWMPWSRRAFTFNMACPSLRLFIGVSGDCNTSQTELSKTPIPSHNLHEDASDEDRGCFFGRVAIDMNNFYPDTEYTLFYKLYQSSKTPERFPCGTITIRVRLQYHSERALFMLPLRRKNKHRIDGTVLHVKKKRDLRLAQLAINGVPSLDFFSLKMIADHVHEIASYKYLLFPILKALSTVLFWQNSFRLQIRVLRFCPRLSEEFFYDKITTKVSIYIPLHSMIAFCAGIVLVEHPYLIPSFLFGFGGWFMLAMLNYRNSHPSPWKHGKSIGSMMISLMFGTSWGNRDIKAYENEEKVTSYEIEQTDRMIMIRVAEEKAAEELLVNNTNHEILGDIRGGNSKKKTPFSTKEYHEYVTDETMHNRMLPLQQLLSRLCEYLRSIRSVVYWDECYRAFWLTVFCFLLGVASYFVPWATVILWGARLIVWITLGPWMKIVGICFGREQRNDGGCCSCTSNSDHHITKEGKECTQERRWKKVSKLLKCSQIEREKCTKLYDTKSLLFGKYRVKVPRRIIDRHVDTPLTLSFAAKFEKKIETSRAVQSFVKEQSTNINGIIPQEQTKHAILKSPIVQTAHEQDTCLDNTRNETMPLMPSDRNNDAYGTILKMV